MEDFVIEDDLQVDENYQELDVTPRPPLPGNYAFKTVSWEFKKDKKGNMVYYKDSQGNPTYPVFSVKMVEISDPFEYGRKVGIFQDVPTNPFEREGKKVSRSADLLKSFDVAAVAANTGEVIKQVSERLTASDQFKARLDYTGYDKDFVQAQFDAAGGQNNLTKKQVNDIYSRARVRGYKNILKDNQKNGRPELPMYRWVGPSGNVFDVRPELTLFYPADEDVNLGPDKGLL